MLTWNRVFDVQNSKIETRYIDLVGDYIELIMLQ